jgi:hypothetical protein
VVVDSSVLLAIYFDEPLASTRASPPKLGSSTR